MFLPQSPRQAQGDDLPMEFGEHKDTSLVRQSASLRSRPSPPTRGGNSFTFTPPQDVRLPTEVSPRRLPGRGEDTVPDVKTNKMMPKSPPLQMPSNAVPKPAGANKRRISLRYTEEDNPRSDLLTLAGGQGNPVVVQMIAAGGRAEHAGVKPGAVIVAINGSTAFQNFPAWQVRAIIQPPATVDLEQEMQLSPASPRCKEIRLTRKSELQLGIAPKSGAWHPKDSVMLAEEVIFKPRTAPLWLSSFDGEGRQRPASPIYELRRPEAHRLVNNAVRTAWDTVSKQAEHVSRVPRGSRSQSSSPYCGLETCLPAWSNGNGGNAWKWDPNAGMLSPRRAPQAPQAQSPASPLAGAPSPPQLPLSSRGSWNVGQDASPLRWVSPVFAPFLGYSNTCSPSSRRGPRSPSNSPRNRSSSPKPRKARGDTEDVVDPELPNAGLLVQASFSHDEDESSGVLLQHQL